MTDAMEHRGPDDSGFHIRPGIGLGMRRLSIIDVEGGRQPISNEDGTVVVVCNGEIYNYQELTDELVGLGHKFSTASDVEVIAHLYEEHGPAMLGRLRGMFALALWDEATETLFVARDRLGIKPLYYAKTGEGLVFASEIKALVKHPSITARLDHQGLSDFLSLKYVPAPTTMFEGISSLLPGHCMTVRNGSTKVERYWDFDYTDDDRSTDLRERLDQFDALLHESVRLRLRSDVPFGAFLSGGVDSSLVVALMSEMLDEPVKTFSVGFEAVDGRSDELPYARLVAERFGTDHHEVLMGAKDFVDLAEQTVWHVDMPLADPALIATLMVSRLASGSVKMVLTGEGGDELFAGYARYVGERFERIARVLPTRTALRLSHRATGLRRASIALNALGQRDEVTRFLNWFPLFNSIEKDEILSMGLRATLQGTTTEWAVKRYLDATASADSVHRMLYVDTRMWLPDYLLLRGDKLTMAASIEGRVPLLDHTLVEFAASLPSNLKVRGFRRKYLLKQLAMRYLPKEIVGRRKQGFPIPIGAWMRKEARPLIQDLLSPAVIRQRGLFDPEVVQRMLDEHVEGKRGNTNKLWGLAGLELWQRRFIDGS